MSESTTKGSVAISILLMGHWSVYAAGRSQGAIVVRDDAPVYAHADGDKIEWRLKRGDAVSGITSGLAPKFLLDVVNGRLHVLYFTGEQKAMSRTAWMDSRDLSRFSYDGTCGPQGSPLVGRGFFHQRWNACFETARDSKLETLRVLWAQTAAATAAPIPALAAPVPPVPTPATK